MSTKSEHMSGMRRYRTSIIIVAIQLDLETKGLDYQKWGGPQHAKAQDWIVNSNGEVYTIDAESFADTYESVGQGHYKKTAPTWAKRADKAGEVSTKEGISNYVAGDWLASNDPEGNDMYAISSETFNATFEPYTEG